MLLNKVLDAQVHTMVCLYKHKKGKLQMKNRLFLLLFSLSIISPTYVFAENKSSINQRLDKIIQQEKYTYLDKDDTGETLLDKFRPSMNFLERVSDAIGDFFQTIWNISPIVSIIIIVAIVGLLVWFIIRQIIRADIDPSKKSKNKNFVEKGSYNFHKQLKIAQDLLKKGHFKKAISTAMNALWLFFHYKKYIRYEKSTTNREYLHLYSGIATRVVNTPTDTMPVLEYKPKDIEKIIMQAERAVYYKDDVYEPECQSIIGEVAKLISQ